MRIGHLLFQTHGALDKRTWWKAQIFIWLFLAFTFWIYMKFGFHDALFTSILWLVFFWWKTNVNIKRLHDRGHQGWGVFGLAYLVRGAAFRLVDRFRDDGVVRQKEGKERPNFTVDYGASP